MIMASFPFVVARLDESRVLVGSVLVVVALRLLLVGRWAAR
jgi:hypothetical protein